MVKLRNVKDIAENFLQAERDAETISEEFRQLKLENERDSGYVHTKNQ